MAQTQKSTASKSAPKAAATGSIRRVAVIGGNRIPFARSNTAYSKLSNQEMLTATLRGLVDRFGLEGQRLGEVAAGAVIKHSRDFNLTRESVLSSGLAPETPAYDVQQACGTGLEAAILLMVIGTTFLAPVLLRIVLKDKPPEDGNQVPDEFAADPLAGAS